LLDARRLVAEEDGVPVGVVSLNGHRDEPTSSNLTGLWVAPAARNRGIGTLLVEAAADLETQDGKTQLYYWVSTENASAIALASNIGFRVTSQRRRASGRGAQLNEQEVAFAMSLEPDPGSVPNASSAP
jgi:ribosomal protein S18 acetylase RimI-like enzyme